MLLKILLVVHEACVVCVLITIFFSYILMMKKIARLSLDHILYTIYYVRLH
jgi:hypothetical protein